MNAKQFAKFLKDKGACAEDRRWCAGKSMQKAWSTTHNGLWMIWLLSHVCGDRGYPSREFYTHMRHAWVCSPPDYEAAAIRSARPVLYIKPKRHAERTHPRPAGSTKERAQARSRSEQVKPL